MANFDSKKITMFTPISEFKWIDGPRIVAHYVPGLTYTYHPDRTNHKALAKALDEWIGEGKVMLVDVTISMAQVQGKGE